MGGGEDGEGGWRGRGGKLGKIGREGGKEGKFPARVTCAAPRREEGNKGWEGGQGVGEKRSTPCPPLANKNQIHQEYSGLR